MTPHISGRAGPNNNDGNIAIADAGVDDKRPLVVEPEFAQCLKVMGRKGNFLSTVIRQAWDSGDLQTLTSRSYLSDCAQPCTQNGVWIRLTRNADVKLELNNITDKTPNRVS